MILIFDLNTFESSKSWIYNSYILFAKGDKDGMIFDTTPFIFLSNEYLDSFIIFRPRDNEWLC